MKNRLFKIILAMSLTLGIIALFTFAINNNVYASEGGEIVDTLGTDEGETTDTTATEEQPSENEVEENEEEEQSAITQEDMSKIDSLIAYLQNLDKDEIMDVINTAKSWLIAGGITTILAFLGAIIGLIIGLLLCWLQQQYGIVRLGSSEGSFVVNAYPVSVHPTDIILVFITVLTVGFISVWYPVRYFSRRLL